MQPDLEAVGSVWAGHPCRLTGKLRSTFFLFVFCFKVPRVTTTLMHKKNDPFSSLTYAHRFLTSLLPLLCWLSSCFCFAFCVRLPFETLTGELETHVALVFTGEKCLVIPYHQSSGVLKCLNLPMYPVAPHPTCSPNIFSRRLRHRRLL